MSSRRPTTPRGPSGSRRPAEAARPRAASAAMAPLPRGLSRRTAVLAGLLLIVGIAVAPFLRDAVHQQAELAALQQSVAEQQQRVDELSSQLKRWDDPAFVKAQARERLKYVNPGEVGYIVLDEAPAQEPQQDTPTGVATPVPGSDRPWFGQLWESVQRAGEAEPDAAGEPTP